MTRRRRPATTRVILVVTAMALVLAIVGLRARGLRVVVTNASPAPIIGLQLALPDGAILLPRIEPGSSASAMIRRPFALPGGPSGSIPLVVTFRHRGDRSAPLPVRCSIGWVGARQLDLDVSESAVHRHVDVVSAMDRLREVSLRRLARNTVRPGVGPRRFVSWQRESISTRVITRRNWAAELGTASAVASRFGSYPIRGAIPLLEYLVYATDELASATRPRRPPDPIHLPFPDLTEAIANLRLNLVQYPLWP